MKTVDSKRAVDGVMDRRGNFRVSVARRIVDILDALRGQMDGNGVPRQAVVLDAEAVAQVSDETRVPGIDEKRGCRREPDKSRHGGDREEYAPGPARGRQ